MVQIRRKRRAFPRECLRTSARSFLQVVLVSSVIPLTFVARLAFHKQPTDHASVRKKIDPQSVSTGVTAGGDAAPHFLSVSSPDPAVARMFDFLNRVDWDSQTGLIQDSDVVELSHCQLQALNMTNFTSWAYPLINATMYKGKEQIAKRNPPVLVAEQTWKQIQEEFVLELLEMRAQAEHLCNFANYQPALPMLPVLRETASQQLQALAQRTSDAAAEKTRIVFSIIAHHDIEQLRDLIRAISLPQHYILVHLDRRCTEDWETAVRQLASTLDNVVVLKFGTILYETDLVSFIQYRIMHWITQVLQLPFDYYISLDGASFPLRTATGMVDHLVQSDREVWMGSLLHQGQVVNVDQTVHLRSKRLLVTSSPLKLTVRVPRENFRDQVLPEHIVRFMKKKTNSGNQAIYSRSVVEELVQSPAVRELFALSKYGCCCCLEERTWITAMGLVGRQEAALGQASVFQVWGGTSSDCESSMKNAILTKNATLCYKVEDGTITSVTPSLVFSHGQYFMGNETWAYLLNARERGILFARKFSSVDTLSLQLKDDVRDTLWTGGNSAPLER